VALYPDVVLASLLPATTFPDQVSDAAGWLRSQGGQADEPPQDRNWDGSVAALLQFPDVLTWLDENDAWEEQMAVAVSNQQGDVLDEIQRFRSDTMEAGNLQSNQYQVVNVQEAPPAPADGGPAPQPTVTIAPAQPDTVYVPQYNPTQVVQPAPTATTVSPWVNFGTGMVVGGLGAWAMYSIFDDDDDWDDDWHGGGHHGGHNQKVNIHDNVIYTGGNRGPGRYGPNRGGAWNPAPRPAQPRPGGWNAPRPTPYRANTAKPRSGYAGVRAPSKPGMNRPPSPVATTRPAPRPGGENRPVAKPSPPPQLARDGGGRQQADRGRDSLQAKNPAQPAKAAKPAAQRQPQAQQKPQARPSTPAPKQAPKQPAAMQRTPTKSTRQQSQRGNASMGGKHGGGGGGGGQRGGGGGGRGGKGR
jgi:hypothetical protein